MAGKPLPPAAVPAKEKPSGLPFAGRVAGLAAKPKKGVAVPPAGVCWSLSRGVPKALEGGRGLGVADGVGLGEAGSMQASDAGGCGLVLNGGLVTRCASPADQNQCQLTTIDQFELWHQGHQELLVQSKCCDREPQMA